MAAYATIEDIENRIVRDLSEKEITIANNLLEDAAVIIDLYNVNATPDAKKQVSIRVVIRALGDGASDIPIGASQASQSGLGYSQSWTYGSGSSGEIYLSKLEKKMLGCGNNIGSYSPVQELAPQPEEPSETIPETIPGENTEEENTEDPENAGD